MREEEGDDSNGRQVKRNISSVQAEANGTVGCVDSQDDRGSVSENKCGRRGAFLKEGQTLKRRSTAVRQGDQLAPCLIDRAMGSTVILLCGNLTLVAWCARPCGCMTCSIAYDNTQPRAARHSSDARHDPFPLPHINPIIKG
jgi:hypothetical protein